jgi:uncharacterized protein YlxW (UPF0749 family)
MVADQKPAPVARPQGGGPGSPPPQAVMGLLNYITATSLDEDYAQVSEQRARHGPVKPGRAGTAALVVLAVFGVLVATAAVQTARNSDQTASSRDALVKQVNERRAQLARERGQAVDLKRSLAALHDSNLAATTQGRAVASRLASLGVAAGAVPTQGPGVRVVVDDAPDAKNDDQRVHGQDLQRLVNALWQVGAEAIAINGQRLTSLSAIRDAGDAITVNFVSLRPPYVVSAIGNRKTMPARLLDTAGGQTWVTLQSSFGLTFDVTTEESMKLPAAKRATLRHARQPERLPGGRR